MLFSITTNTCRLILAELARKKLAVAIVGICGSAITVEVRRLINADFLNTARTIEAMAISTGTFPMLTEVAIPAFWAHAMLHVLLILRSIPIVVYI